MCPPCRRLLAESRRTESRSFFLKIKQKGADGTPVRRHETRYPCPKPPTRRAWTLPWNQWIRMGRFSRRVSPLGSYLLSRPSEALLQPGGDSARDVVDLKYLRGMGGIGGNSKRRVAGSPLQPRSSTRCPHGKNTRLGVWGSLAGPLEPLLMKIEALCAAPPEALTHSPSQIRGNS